MSGCAIGVGFNAYLPPNNQNAGELLPACFLKLVVPVLLVVV
jgi:hypothetical protein